MKNKETVDPGCSFLSTIFSLVVVAIPLYLILKIVYDVWQFLRPDILTRSLEMLGGLVLCFGVGSLLIWLILILPPPKLPYQADDDPFCSDTSKWDEKLIWSPVILFYICSIAIGSLFIPFIAFYVDLIEPRLKRKHIEEPTDT